MHNWLQGCNLAKWKAALRLDKLWKTQMNHNLLFVYQTVVCVIPQAFLSAFRIVISMQKMLNRARVNPYLLFFFFLSIWDVRKDELRCVTVLCKKKKKKGSWGHNLYLKHKFLGILPFFRLIYPQPLRSFAAAFRPFLYGSFALPFHFFLSLFSSLCDSCCLVCHLYLFSAVLFSLFSFVSPNYLLVPRSLHATN